MKALLLCAALLTATSATAREVRLSANMVEGNLVIGLTDVITKEHMDTTLSSDRTKEFFVWVNRKSGAASQQTPMPGKVPPPAEPKGCGFGDFLGGKC